MPCQATPTAAAKTIAPAAISQRTVRDITLPMVRLPTALGVATSLCEMIPCRPGPERHRIACKKEASVSVSAPSSLCVFCGSRFGADPAARNVAVGLRELLAREGVTLVYGGGAVALMGLLPNATPTAGGRSSGIIPRLRLQPEHGPPPRTCTTAGWPMPH